MSPGQVRARCIAGLPEANRNVQPRASPRAPEDAPAFRPGRNPVPREAGQENFATARTARLPPFYGPSWHPVKVRTAYRCRAYPDEAQQQEHGAEPASGPRHLGLRLGRVPPPAGGLESPSFKAGSSQCPSCSQQHSPRCWGPATLHPRQQRQLRTGSNRRMPSRPAPATTPPGQHR